MFTATSPALGVAPIGNVRGNSDESHSRGQRVNSAVKHGASAVNVGPKVVVTPHVSFKDVLASLSPRTMKNSFDDVLNSMEEMLEPSYLDGKLGILFPDKSSSFRRSRQLPLFGLDFRNYHFIYMSKKSLCAIAKLLGKPIKIDDHTAEVSRGAFARVCVEINVLEPPVKHIWVGWGDHLQEIEVVYERIPAYCTDCKMLGHATSVCYSRGKNPWPIKAKSFGPVPPSQTAASGQSPHEGVISGEVQGPQGQVLSQSKSTSNAFDVLSPWQKEAQLFDTSALVGTTSDFVPHLGDVGVVITRGASLEQAPSVGMDHVGLSSPTVAVSPLELGGVSSQSGAKDSEEDDVIPFEDCAEVLGSPHAGIDTVFTEPVICLENHSCHSIPSDPPSPDDVSSLFVQLVDRQGSPACERVARERFVEDHDQGFDKHSEPGDGRASEDGVLDSDMPDVKKKKGRDDLPRSEIHDSSSWFSQVISNLSGHIWVFFAADVQAECVLDHAQFLHIKVSAPSLPTSGFCSFVYAICDYIERRDLWTSLLHVKPVLGPWMVGGDFNVFRDSSECLGTRGGSSIRVEHLSRTVSDHCSLLVNTPVFARGPSSFRFQRMWLRHHGFLQTVRLNWNLPCSLIGMSRLFVKLKQLKHHLKWWNRDVFGNIFDKLTENLLIGDTFVLDRPDFSGFTSVISDEENNEIAVIPSLEEVRATVFSISPDSVAGPNGFSSAFFQHCWEIVHQDVLDAVLDFFRGSPMPHSFTATTITLIPKAEGAHAWYRSGCDLLISHLAYADDIIIFANGGYRGMQSLLDSLHHYENCSGQLVNAVKNSLILPPRCSARLRSRLLRSTGFTEGQLPLKYLGFPLFRGNSTCSLFEPLLQSVRKRLEGWDIRNLSSASRMTLIRSVLLSMSIYLFQVVQPPLAVLEKLEIAFNSFLWGSRPLEKKWHWARWSRACLPVAEGGLGFRRLKDLVDSFSIKL
ncbi:uncharacterized protein LOC142524032 [Primulina tabacum]|uniref:uncharacterized protein LOC142524032 n=1 Tax=Primulina tabacum TaxID=48773 RepID=UPI003F5957E6